MSRIAQLRARMATVAETWLTATLLFLVALAVRLDVDRLSPTDPFVTFYLALVVMTLACGWQRGAFFAVLSAGAGWFFFLRAPAAAYLPATAGSSLLSIASFVLVAGVAIALSEALARAAMRLTADPLIGDDPRLAALHRRARTAVSFVVAPITGETTRIMDHAMMVEAVKGRFDRFVRLDNAVLSQLGDVRDWSERMEAFCLAEVPRDLVLKPVCRIIGEPCALDADRLLAISLAIGEMLGEALTAHCRVFEVELLNDGAGACAVDIRTLGCRAPRWEMPGSLGWPAVSQWLERLLNATITLPTTGEFGIRFDFFD